MEKLPPIIPNRIEDDARNAEHAVIVVRPDREEGPAHARRIGQAASDLQHAKPAFFPRRDLFE